MPRYRSLGARIACCCQIVEIFEASQQRERFEWNQGRRRLAVLGNDKPLAAELNAPKKSPACDLSSFTGTAVSSDGSTLVLSCIRYK